MVDVSVSAPLELSAVFAQEGHTSATYFQGTTQDLKNGTKSVCNADSSCAHSWDGSCVGEATRICGRACSGLQSASRPL